MWDEKENWRILTNKETLEIFRKPTITETIRLRSFWHVERMEGNRITKRVLYMNLGTTRLRGRPRNRWHDKVREDGRIVGWKVWNERLYNWEEWKKLLRTARNRRVLHTPVEWITINWTQYTRTTQHASKADIIFYILKSATVCFCQANRLPHSLEYKSLFVTVHINTYLLTYSTVQSPSWDVNWFAASQEIPRISRNPKVHYRTHKRPPPVSILGQPNPVHTPTFHLLEIHPNIIHPSKPRYPQSSLSLRFLHQDPMHPPPSPRPYAPHAQPISFFSILSPAQHKYVLHQQMHIHV